MATDPEPIERFTVELLENHEKLIEGVQEALNEVQAMLNAGIPADTLVKKVRDAFKPLADFFVTSGQPMEKLVEAFTEAFGLQANEVQILRNELSRAQVLYGAIADTAQRATQATAQLTAATKAQLEAAEKISIKLAGQTMVESRGNQFLVSRVDLLQRLKNLQGTLGEFYDPNQPEGQQLTQGEGGITNRFGAQMRLLQSFLNQPVGGPFDEATVRKINSLLERQIDLMSRMAAGAKEVSQLTLANATTQQALESKSVSIMQARIAALDGEIKAQRDLTLAKNADDAVTAKARAQMFAMIGEQNALNDALANQITAEKQLISLAGLVLHPSMIGSQDQRKFDNSAFQQVAAAQLGATVPGMLAIPKDFFDDKTRKLNQAFIDYGNKGEAIISLALKNAGAELQERVTGWIGQYRIEGNTDITIAPALMGISSLEDKVNVDIKFISLKAAAYLIKFSQGLETLESLFDKNAQAFEIAMQQVVYGLTTKRSQFLALYPPLPQGEDPIAAAVRIANDDRNRQLIPMQTVGTTAGPRVTEEAILPYVKAAMDRLINSATSYSVLSAIEAYVKGGPALQALDKLAAAARAAADALDVEKRAAELTAQYKTMTPKQIEAFGAQGTSDAAAAQSQLLASYAATAASAGGNPPPSLPPGGGGGSAGGGGSTGPAGPSGASLGDDLQAWRQIVVQQRLSVDLQTARNRAAQEGIDALKVEIAQRQKGAEVSKATTDSDALRMRQFKEQKADSAALLDNAKADLDTAKGKVAALESQARLEASIPNQDRSDTRLADINGRVAAYKQEFAAAGDDAVAQQKVLDKIDEEAAAMKEASAQAKLKAKDDADIASSASLAAKALDDKTEALLREAAALRLQAEEEKALHTGTPVTTAAAADTTGEQATTMGVAAGAARDNAIALKAVADGSKQMANDVNTGAKALNNLGNALQTGEEDQKSFFETMTGGINIVRLFAGALITGLVFGAFQQISAGFQQITQYAKDFSNSLAQMEAAVNASQQFFGKAAGSQQQWADAVANLRKEFGVFSSTDLQQGITTLLSMTRDLELTTDQTMKLAHAAAVLGATTPGSTFQQAAEAIARGVGGYQRSLGALNELETQIARNRVASDLFGAQYTSISKANKVIVDYTIIMDQANVRAEAAGAVIDTAGQRQVKAANAINDALKPLGALWNNIVTTITESAAGIAEALGIIYKNVVDFYANMTTSATFAITYVAYITAQASRLITDSTSVFKEAWSTASRVATDAGNIIRERYGTISSSIADTGVAVQGLVDGFDDLDASAQAAFTGLNDLIDQANKKLDDAVAKRNQALEDEKAKNISAILQNERTFQDALTANDKKRGDDTIKAQQDLNETLYKDYQDYNKTEQRDQEDHDLERQKQIDDAAKAQEKASKDHNNRLKKIQEDAWFALMDAVQAQDARQVLLALRNRNKAVNDENQNYQDESAQRAADLAASLADLDKKFELEKARRLEDYNQKVQEAKDQEKKQEDQIQADWKQQNSDIHNAYQTRANQIAHDDANVKRQINDDFKQQQHDITQWLGDQVDAFAKTWQKQYDITDDQMKKIYGRLLYWMGPNGQIVQLFTDTLDALKKMDIPIPQPNNVVCPFGHHWDPQLGACVPDTGGTPPPHPHNCPPNYHWDDTKGKCISDKQIGAAASRTFQIAQSASMGDGNNLSTVTTRATKKMQYEIKVTADEHFSQDFEDKVLNTIADIFEQNTPSEGSFSR